MNLKRVIGGLLLVTLLFQSALAEAIPLGPIPLPAASGIAISVSVESVGGNGYQPVHLTIRPRATTFPRDRRLSVVISPENQQKTSLDFTYRAELFAPQGATIVEETLLVPHYYPWDNLVVSFSEDGSPMRGGRGRFSLASKLRGRDTDQLYSVGIVLPRDEKTQDAAWKKFPDVRGLVTVLGNGPIPEEKDAKTERLGHQAALDRAKQVQPAHVQFRVIEESRLPDQWLAHSQLDVMIVAAPVLQRIQQEQPEGALAIEKWIAAGGSLWVYAGNLAPVGFMDNGDLKAPPAARMVRKEALADRLDLNLENDTSPLNYQSWGIMKESQVYGYQDNNKFKRRRAVFNELTKASHPLAEVVKPAEIAGRLRIGRLGLGTVTTIADEDPFPGSYQLWYSLVDQHPPQQMVWTERMGIDVPAGNDNYWMWLIPSVGQPPVKTFVFLNALFALIVGPLCYFYFRRRGRLYLLYFAAPLMALVITVSLFVFALTSDGIQTKLRSRQLTWVDPSSGNHVQQARQTYYAVMSRDRGIRTDNDVAVYPVRYSPTFDYGYYGMRSSDDRLDGQVIAGADERTHVGGFFPSRSQVQYLSMNVAEDEGSVRFSASTSEVTNQLEIPFQELIIRDKAGKFWKVTDVPAGETKAMTQAEQIDVEELLGPDVRPPLGEVPMLRRSYYRSWGNMTTGVQVSLLESRMDDWAADMPAGSFLGLAELDRERLGIEDAKVLDSFHVIMGVLP